LIDTRSDVQRWANHPVEFHFATVLSPWIRRALVAGGFGISTHARVPSEIAPIVPYRGGCSDRWPADSIRSKTDVEAHEPSEPHGGTQSEETGPLLATDTPFFHFDLASAVRAAESKLVRSPSWQETPVKNLEP
ncbi:hypothetical protein PAXRUDRAFT_22023, partial [Paxillus rubicundulus Ve08.2h10]